MESRWRWLPQCYLNVHANCTSSCCLIISQRGRRIRMRLCTSWFHTLGEDPGSVTLSLFELLAASMRTVLWVRSQRVKLRCQAVWVVCVSYAGSFLGTPALLNLMPLQGGEFVCNFPHLRWRHLHITQSGPPSSLFLLLVIPQGSSFQRQRGGLSHFSNYIQSSKLNCLSLYFSHA